jgi:hypothetical protein
LPRPTALIDCAAEGAPVQEIRQLETALIVDDHPLFCDALSMTLRAIAGLRMIETADGLETALARLDRGPVPDVVVLDLNLPDVTGLEGYNLYVMPWINDGTKIAFGIIKHIELPASFV